MDKLLQPDTGLMIWTVVTFLVALLVLSKTAWKPIINGLAAREKKIREDLQNAEDANKEAIRLQADFAAKLTDAQKTIQAMMAEARSDAAATQAKLLEAAKAEAEKLLQKGRRNLEQETEKLKSVLEREVASLSVQIAEKVTRRAVGAELEKEALAASIKELEGFRP